MNLGCAFEFYLQHGDVEHAVAIAEYPLHPLPAEAANMLTLIGKALTLVSGDSHQAARLLSRYGRVLGLEQGDYDAAKEAFDQALSIAWRESDIDLALQITANQASVEGFHLHWQKSLEKSLKALELSRQANQPHAIVDSHLWATMTLQFMGATDKVQHHATAMLTLAEQLRDRYWLTVALFHNESMARLQGIWRRARVLSDRALAVDLSDPRVVGCRASLEYEVGDFELG
jgi:tetratricopeptide (TPR) repeat protein